MKEMKTEETRKPYVEPTLEKHEKLVEITEGIAPGGISPIGGAPPV